MKKAYPKRVRLFSLYKIRVSKGLNFPCRLIFPILHHNIYQRCAASPQDIVAQSLKNYLCNENGPFDTLIVIVFCVKGHGPLQDCGGTL